jgi:hypothetical protein
VAACGDGLELRFGLVIGVNRYKQHDSGPYRLTPLEAAERDASALTELLAGRLRFHKVLTLTGAEATAGSVAAAFDWLRQASAAAAHPNSCFVFHFSGHGFLDPDGGEDAYLMLHDSDPASPGESALEMRRLVYELVPQVRVPNALVLLDACHSGHAAGVKDLQPANQLNNVVRQLVSSLRGRMVLAACPGRELAREDAALGHGLFTYHVLKHWRDLDGAAAGLVSFASLVDYVGSRMAELHRGLPLPVSSWVGEGPTFVLRRG